RGNGNIRMERSGIWITTPGLEARTEKLASRFASPSKRSRRIRQLSPCHIRSCLAPSTRPNGTRCTWYCASENTRHTDILQTPPLRGELVLGLAAHYLIGIVL